MYPEVLVSYTGDVQTYEELDERKVGMMEYELCFENISGFPVFYSMYKYVPIYLYFCKLLLISFCM